MKAKASTLKQSAAPAAMTLAILLFAGAAQANEPAYVDAGSEHKGNVETRNSPIRVGDEASVLGNVQSRNGSIQIGDRVTTHAISSRNGAITIGDGSQVESVDARNGSITLGSGVQAHTIKARNGAIRLGGETRVRAIDNRNGMIEVGPSASVEGSVDTRNGAIRVGRNGTIGADATTRNGAIELAEDSRVEGNATSRNGRIRLLSASVGGHVRVLSGDIELENGSEVGGDVRIDITDAGYHSGGFFGLGGTTRYPEAGSIHIRGGSTVKGDLELLLPEDYNGEIPSLSIDADSTVESQIRVDSRVNLDIADEGTAARVERVTP